MARAVALLLFVVAVATTINAVPSCGPNEVFNSCGSSCPITCQSPVPRACNLACVSGCDCVNGYLRNSEHQCVPLHKC